MTTADVRADGDVGVAIDRGVAHVADLSTDGRWHGFPTLAGTSDLWVTAFVVWHLAQLGRRPRLVAESRRFLAGARADEGWGYSADVPADADSTSWCLLALHRSNRLDAAGRHRAVEFLLDHVEDPGGVSTYLPGSGIRDYISAGPSSTAGWMSAHPDVTAVALLTEAFPPGGEDGLRSLDWLIASQDRAGVVPAYWWRPPYYSAAMTLRACLRHGVRPPRLFVDRLVELLCGKQLPHGGFGLGASPFTDPFTTALALECLSILAADVDPGPGSAAAAALLETQRRDGGWDGELVLRIPAPSVVDPRTVDIWGVGVGGGNSYVPDENGVFASVLACHALQAHERITTGAGVLAPDLPRLDTPREPIDPSIAEIINPLPEDAERCNTGGR